MTASDAVLQMCAKHGWSFQQPYTLALKEIVARRRSPLNEVQIFFWMSEATEAQKLEAIEDACAVMEAAKHT